LLACPLGRQQVAVNLAVTKQTLIGLGGNFTKQDFKISIRLTISMGTFLLA
jgi:hypothetical protein